MKARSFTAVLALATCGAAFAFAAPARAASGCAAAVIQAWHNGRLDASYAPACYRQALQELPEDIRIYSSAQDDINRALIASFAKKSTARRTSQGAVKGIVRKLQTARSTNSVRREAAAAAADPSASTVPLTVLISGAGALALIGVASISVLARRLGRDRAS